MKLKIFALLLAVLLLAGCGNQTDHPAVSDTANAATEGNAALDGFRDFTVYDGNSDPVKLSDYLGKPIVLNFWASWCGPCKSEMPAFQALYEELGDQVQFLMVNVGELMDEAQSFIASTGYTFPVLFDVNGEAAYTFQISAIPATFLFNTNGELVDAHVGAMSENDLRTAIEKIEN